MPELPADFTGTMQPVYRVRLAPGEQARIEWVVGGESPAKLSLALQDHAGLTPALLNPAQSGAILVLDMRWEEMRAIYSAICDLAERMGLPLPERSKKQRGAHAAFQKNIPAEPPLFRKPPK